MALRGLRLASFGGNRVTNPVRSTLLLAPCPGAPGRQADLLRATECLNALHEPCDRFRKRARRIHSLTEIQIPEPTHFKLRCSCGEDDYKAVPELAIFDITERDAAFLTRMAAVVKKKALRQAESFDSVST